MNPDVHFFHTHSVVFLQIHIGCQGPLQQQIENQQVVQWVAAYNTFMQTQRFPDSLFVPAVKHTVSASFPAVHTCNAAVFVCYIMQLPSRQCQSLSGNPERLQEHKHRASCLVFLDVSRRSASWACDTEAAGWPPAHNCPTFCGWKFCRVNF